MSRGSSVSTMTELRVGRPGFAAQEEIFFFATSSTPAPEPTQSPVKWVKGDLSPGGEADKAWRRPPTSIQRRGQKHVEPYLHSPLRPHDAVPCQAQEQLCLIRKNYHSSGKNNLLYLYIKSDTSDY
jgi:hypothetical protein